MRYFTEAASTFILSIGLFFGQFAFALVTGPNLVIGVVKSVSDKVVVVIGEDRRFEVPRDLVPGKTIKVGEKIEVAIPQDKLSAVKITLEKK